MRTIEDVKKIIDFAIKNGVEIKFLDNMDCFIENNVLDHSKISNLDYVVILKDMTLSDIFVAIYYKCLKLGYNYYEFLNSELEEYYENKLDLKNG